MISVIIKIGGYYYTDICYNTTVRQLMQKQANFEYSINCSNKKDFYLAELI
jgi:hypothetical protein